MENLTNLTVSYEDLASAASTMTDEAGKIKSAIEKIDEIVTTTLNANWQGTSWNAYNGQFQKLQEPLQEAVNMFAKYGQNLAEIAQKYSQNEDRNMTEAGSLGTEIF